MFHTCIQCWFYGLHEGTCCNPNSKRYELSYCNPDAHACGLFEKEEVDGKNK